MSTISYETVPEAFTSTVPQSKRLNAEAVTTMTTAFLKRLGQKGGLKPKSVSLEGEIYTVEVEPKKFTAVVQDNAGAREIKEYDVQPKSEESSFSFSPQLILTVLVVSAVVNVTLHFVLQMLGL